MKAAARPAARSHQLAKKALNLQNKKRYAEAEELWCLVTKEDASAESFYNHGVCLKYNGFLSEAIQAFVRSAKLRPESKTLTEIGNIYREQHLFDQAREILTKALEMDENNHEAWAEMALTYFLENKPEHAILLMQKAQQIKGDPSQRYIYFMNIIFKNFVPKTFNENFKQLILEGLKSKHVAHEHYVTPWRRTFTLDPVLLPSIVPFTKARSLNQFDLVFATKPAFTVDPFFLYGLKMIRITEIPLEEMLKSIRWYFLRKSTEDKIYPYLKPLLFALADQCFFNEYVYSYTPEEEPIFENLVKEIETGDLEKIDNLDDKLAVIGCYTPLFTLKNAKKIAEYIEKRPLQSEDLQSLITIQILDHLQEQNIKKKIPSIGSIEDEVSKKVQEQYEESPYPRWRDHAHSDGTVFKLSETEFDKDQHQNVLVAGCGTGKQIAILRILLPEAPITAIDISRTSLAYAQRKCQEFGYDNISFIHADILDVEKLDQKFDSVYCTGVLHHMKDPLKGWQALANVLKPGGYMKIGLYSETARQHIVATRDFIQKNGYPATPKGIRDCRDHIKTLPQSDIISKIMASPDFYTLSSCRDLIFHVQEHRYTLDKISQSLDKVGLKFCKMGFREVDTMVFYKKMFPDDREFKHLENLKEFEKKYPAAFSGMYQFWAVKPLN